jgi:hypothetical protein
MLMTHRRSTRLGRDAVNVRLSQLGHLPVWSVVVASSRVSRTKKTTA